MRNFFYWVAIITTALAFASCNKVMTSAGPARSANMDTSKKQVVATYDAKEITLQELDDSIAHEIYRVRRQNLESMIVRTLVEREAKKLGKTADDYIQGIAGAVADPGEDELRAVYEENKQAFGGRSFEEAKPRLAARQKQTMRQNAVMSHIEELKKKANVRIQLSPPRTVVEAVGPSKGPADAPITIVEFSDFQCPYCSKAYKVVDQVVNAYAGKVRLVFRNFPLSFHNYAAKAAEAGLCAQTQGKFWEMHDWMFDNQDKLSVEALKEGAASLGIDRNKFNNCLDSGEYAEKVEESVKAAKRAGVRGTPAFFVNGRLLLSGHSFDDFKQVIDEELRSRGSTK